MLLFTKYKFDFWISKFGKLSQGCYQKHHHIPLNSFTSSIHGKLNQSYKQSLLTNFFNLDLFQAPQSFGPLFRPSSKKNLSRGSPSNKLMNNCTSLLTNLIFFNLDLFQAPQSLVPLFRPSSKKDLSRGSPSNKLMNNCT